jgi:hypothetical protein
MTDSVFFDTNILVYAFASNDDLRCRVASGSRKSPPTRHSREGRKTTVIPAKAGIQYAPSSQNGCQSKNSDALRRRVRFWIPAFAGMTKEGDWCA